MAARKCRAVITNCQPLAWQESLGGSQPCLHRPNGNSHDHQRKRKSMGRPGINGCDEEHGLTRDPLLPSLLPCSDGHLLGLILTTCNADPPGEGHRPFKLARDDFPREPVMSLLVALCLARLLPPLGLALLLRLLTLRLTLGLVLVLVLMTVATSNRQGVLIDQQFDIFGSHSWECHIHLVAILRLTDVHRCHQR